MAMEFDLDRSDWSTGPFLKLIFSDIDLKVR